MSSSRSSRPGPQNVLPTSLQVGQAFNPFRFFTGIFIPEALARSRLVSPGAKLAYGRLARYAGHHGKCFPAVGTLASEIGVGERQAQKYLAELEKAKLIRRRTRFLGRAQTSNDIEFLWHPLFQEGVNDQTRDGVNDCSLPPVNDSSPKESQTEESHSKETTTDLDHPATNRKKRDSRLDADSPPPTCKKYPRLREALASYMMEEPEDEKVFPQPRQVIEVVDAAAGATEDEILRCLAYLREERGLKPGTKTGPRQFSWFPTVVWDYFQRQRARGLLAAPASTLACNLSQEEFDSMTSAIEI